MNLYATSKNGSILAACPSFTGIRKKFASEINSGLGHDTLTFKTFVIFKALKNWNKIKT